MKKSNPKNKKEEDLKDSFKDLFHFNMLFESSPGLYLVLLPDLTIYAVTDEYLKATMTKREEIVGKHLFEVFPDNPDDATADGEFNLLASLNLVLKNKEPHRMAIQKYDIRKPDGTFEVRYWSPLNKPVLNDKNEVVYLIHSVEDVTLHEKAEKQLKEFKHFFYNSNDPCFIANMDGYFETVNFMCEKLLGYSEREIIKKPFVEFIHPDDISNTLMEYEKQKTEGKVVINLVNRYRKNDGTYVSLEWNSTPDPHSGKIYAIARDITERIKIDQKLRQTIKEISDYKYAIDESALVAITDQKGIIKHVNDYFCNISKYSRDELIGQDHRIINSGHHSKEFIRDLWSTIANGKLWKGELKNKAKDGTFYWVESAIIPFLNEQGKPFQYMSIRFDITEQKKQQELLEAQSEELKVQQEELQETNAELEAQTQKLQTSEEELKAQQEELMQSNHELEEKNQLINEKNEELESASIELYQKAEELALSNKYKSEFLANMSHELRTPLNSILLLSKLLSDDAEDNLTAEQKEFSSVIYNSGNGLLELINDILDLSKVESGKMEIDIENVHLNDIFKSINDLFSRLAKEKEITFLIKQENDISPTLQTDKIRVEQVLKNFLSNAFKFTEKGRVEVIVRAPDKIESKKMRINLSDFICFEVKDSGIGIPKEKHAMVFEAFQQADGSTRRKYGGTGLGLSISREIAHLLGGEICLKSEPGKGSSFSLIIPINNSIIKAVSYKSEITKPLKHGSGNERGAKKDEPIFIPIDFVETTIDHKNIRREQKKKEKTDGELPKKILLVDDNPIHTNAISRFIENHTKKCIIAETAKEAFQILSNEHIDCVVLDMVLPDENGYEILETIKKNKKFEKLPVIIYTGKSISLQEEKRLKQYAGAIVLKTAESFKRLSSEISLLLKIVDGNSDKKSLKKPYYKDEILVNKHVLLVDDDVRNIFSITKMLEDKKMKVTSASDGNEALAILHSDKYIDLVLMDMMMPNKDGYETTIEIRNNPAMNKIPVIAVTAKAMLGDRLKCINAGANDYVTKPVDVDQLLALLRVWLYK